MSLRTASIATVLLLSATFASAQQPQIAVETQGAVGFDAYVQLLIARARGEGVSEATISRMTSGLTPNDRVIRLDRAQPGTPTNSGYPRLGAYLDRHVDAARINGGRGVYRSN